MTATESRKILFRFIWQVVEQLHVYLLRVHTSLCTHMNIQCYGM